MTGYDVYKYIRERHPKAEERLLSDDELAALIHKSKESIRASCGELRRFSAPQVTDNIVNFVKNNGVFETSCGNYICAGSDGKNHLIKTLEENNLLGSDKYKAFVSYSSADPLENVALGVTHVIIFDEGKTIFAEKPHGCIEDAKLTERAGVLIHDDKELAELLENLIWPNNDYKSVTSVDSELVKSVTLMNDDKRWYDPLCKFETEAEFETCLAGYMHEAFSKEG